MHIKRVGFKDGYQQARKDLNKLLVEMKAWKNKIKDRRGISQTLQFMEVCEAVDDLLHAILNLPDSLPPVEASEVEYLHMKGNREGRHSRLQNIVAILFAVRDGLDAELLRKHNIGKLTMEEATSYSRASDKLTDVAGDLMTVRFPGIYQGGGRHG